MGWRLLACPSFGGNFDCWPCWLLRRIVQPDSPDVLFCSIKDNNIPGKVLLSGKTATAASQSLAIALGADLEKDKYDDDHDVALRNTEITTGHAVFSFKLKYFPKGDGVMNILETCPG